MKLHPLSCTTIALLLAAPCALAQSSPWFVGAGLTVTKESNLLRLTGEQQPLPGTSKADTVSSSYLLAGLNQAIGRQTVQGNFVVRDNRYDKNGAFNNQSYNASVGLEWSTIERISGSLGAGTSRSLSTFNNEGVGQLDTKNLESVQSLNATVRVGLITDYGLELRLSRNETENSLDNVQVRTRDQVVDSASLGLRWAPSDLLSVALSGRQTNVLYPTFFVLSDNSTEEDRYNQQSLDLVATWRASGASTLDLRLNRSRTRYDRNASRNAPATTGSLGWNWRATGKLGVQARLTRDQQFWSSTFLRVFPTANDSTNTTLGLQLEYAWSSKVALTSGLQYAERKIRARVLNQDAAPLQAQDQTTVFTFGARWAPTRSTLFGCDFNNNRRTASGLLTASLNGSSTSCYGQITLQ